MHQRPGLFHDWIHRMLLHLFKTERIRSNSKGRHRLMQTILHTLLLAAFLLLPGSLASATPDARVQPVLPGESRWENGFLFERFENLRTNMLPSMIRLMEGTNYSQYLENFRIAAGQADGRPRGAPFNDGDFYKMLEALTLTLAVTNEPRLATHLDTAVQLIAAAQRPDGYLHTPVLIRSRLGDADAVPFRDRTNFELYNMGHLMTLACIHHQQTGSSRLLDVARKAADFLESTLAGPAPEAARSSVCPSHFMGLVDLWRTTRDERYLNLARRFLSLRSQIRDGGDDNQDRIPFTDQTNAVGHAVRATYLYAGATDLFLETGDSMLWQPLEKIWQNMVHQKMHVTGGCGALYDGASPEGSRDQRSITRTHQAFGRNYQLPNTTAHNETCAAVGNILWNHRMFLATGESRYIDVLETALYNALLAGVGLDGTNFFYTNPLRVTRPLPQELRWSRTRVPFVSSFCCPPNVLRTLARSPAYAYAKSARTLWINLYGAGTLTTSLDGAKVRLNQETAYPWDGRIRIVIRENAGSAFALKLRVPAWASDSFKLRCNRREAMTRGRSNTRDSQGYVELKTDWRTGDTIDLEFPMPVRRIEANPLVEETLNQVAFQRGPVIYCLESADLPPDTDISEIQVSSRSRIKARQVAGLLGGTVVLEGSAQRRPSPPWNGQLYREMKPTEAATIPVTLIPYALWANRGPGTMTVWIPKAER